MNLESSSLPGGRFSGEGMRSVKGGDDVAVKYARLQGYLEGYLDQMSASKDAQEELISKLLSELADILNPISSTGRSE